MTSSKYNSTPAVPVLSLQQRAIRYYLDRGLTPAAIAGRLGTSPKAVAIQIRRIT